MKIPKEKLSGSLPNSHMIIAKSGSERVANIEHKNILYLGLVENHDCCTEYEAGTFVRIRHMYSEPVEFILEEEENEN